MADRSCLGTRRQVLYRLVRQKCQQSRISAFPPPGQADSLMGSKLAAMPRITCAKSPSGIAQIKLMPLWPVISSQSGETMTPTPSPPTVPSL